MNKDGSNNYCTFYIIRHGETEGNVKKILQGHSDYPLTKEGISQAKQAAKRLESIHFDEAFSSDLFRAKHTAELILLEKKIAVKTTEKLRERSFDKYEGKPWLHLNSELKEMWAKYEKLQDKEKFKFKFSEKQESDDELSTRMITFLREIAITYPGKTILIVSHGGIMRSFLIRLGFGTYQTLLPGAVVNLAYIKVRSDGVDFLIDETEGIEIHTSL